MKVLYVDIDGPLATDASSKIREDTKWRKNLYRMDTNCVRVLNEIISETNCELIVSSDWRKYFTIEELGEIFEWNGIIRKPIGVTSQERISFTNDALNRIHQIKKSLDELKPEMWAVIDDLPLGLEYNNVGLTNYVYCDEIVGLFESTKKEEVLNFLTEKQ